MNKINSFPNLNFNNPNLWNWGAIALLMVYLAPLLIFGGELHFLVFDNLDSNVVWFKVLAESGKIFAPNDAIIPNIMGGLSRSAYGSEFDVLLWFYYFLTPLQAYILNELIMHSVAFLSMYIFLDRYMFKDNKEHKYIYINIGALFFAVLPFWPSAGLSIPLMPLVTYALLRIEEGASSWKLWVLLFLLPLYSSFVVVYFFYLFLAAIYFIRQTIVKKIFNTHLFLALVFLVIIFMLKEYRVVLEMFLSSNFISNRTEYTLLSEKDFITAYRYSLLHFLDGVPHARGIHRDIILPTVLYLLLLSFHKEKLSVKHSLIFILLFALTHVTGVWQIVLRQIYTLPLIITIMILLISFGKNRLLAILILSQVIISLWTGFSFYEGWTIFYDYIPGLKMFNFSRFFFMSSMIWALIAALSIKMIIDKLMFSKLWATVFIGFLLYMAINISYFGLRVQKDHLPFEKYYASKQFSEIKEYINRPQNSYKIISLGLEPSISQFNGFHTLDGYMVNYPLSYKHEFRKIISKYLLEDDIIRKKFDGWGSKLYIFNKNVIVTYTNILYIRAMHNLHYTELNFNTTQISKMGAEYMLSSHIIDKPESHQLSFLKTFTHPDSLWSISLYKVNVLE